MSTDQRADQDSLEGTDPNALTGSEDQQESLPGESEQTFFNPADVPEPLRPTFLEMKKSFTQATQAVAETKKALAAEKETLSAAAYKAQLFDALTADPRVQGFLAQIRDNGSGMSPAQEAGEDLNLDPQVEKILTQRLAPLEKRLENLQQQTALASEKNAFLAAHPDFVFDEWKDDLEKTWAQFPNLSMEAAFRIARDGRGQRTQQDQAKRAALGRTPVERGGSSLPAKPQREIRSIRDAAAAALDQLGMNRRDYLPRNE